MTRALLGFVTMLASPHAQRLGDLAAATYVVRDRRGDDSTASLEAFALRTTVPYAEVEHWDVSAVTAQELQVIRQFLARRLAIPAPVRYQLGVDLARRVAVKVTGLPAQSHPEYVLEGVVVAKDARS